MNSLGNVTSPDGSAFLVLDTEDASVPTSSFGDTMGSILESQSFTVLAPRRTLSLVYNFLTDEGTPSSSYNDFARVNLLSNSGNLLTTLAAADTFSGDYTGAGSSGYNEQTGWKQLNANLAQYSGQDVKLQFVVSD